MKTIALSLTFSLLALLSNTTQAQDDVADSRFGAFYQDTIQNAQIASREGAPSGDICVATRVHEVFLGGSAMAFNIDCGNGVIFSTKPNLTGIIFPMILPDHWTKTAETRLTKLMSKYNYQAVSKLIMYTTNIRGDFSIDYDKRFVFKKSYLPHGRYVRVLKWSKKTIGLANKTTVYDVQLQFDVHDVYQTEYYNGLTQEEIDSLLLQKGYKPTTHKSIYEHP